MNTGNSPPLLKGSAGKAPAPRLVNNWFRRLSSASAAAAGSPWTFATAALFLALWACSYPLFFRFPDPFNTWQLVVNTVTTIVTFLMVFLIQNTQNRDAKAIHLKLDELIRAMKGARNWIVELENCTDEELEQLRKEFERIHQQASGEARKQADQDLARVAMEEAIRTRDA